MGLLGTSQDPNYNPATLEPPASPSRTTMLSGNTVRYSRYSTLQSRQVPRRTSQDVMVQSMRPRGPDVRRSEEKESPGRTLQYGLPPSPARISFLSSAVGISGFTPSLRRCTMRLCCEETKRDIQRVVISLFGTKCDVLCCCRVCFGRLMQILRTPNTK